MCEYCLNLITKRNNLEDIIIEKIKNSNPTEAGCIICGKKPKRKYYCVDCAKINKQISRLNYRITHSQKIIELSKKNYLKEKENFLKENTCEDLRKKYKVKRLKRIDNDKAAKKKYYNKKIKGNSNLIHKYYEQNIEYYKNYNKKKRQQHIDISEYWNLFDLVKSTNVEIIKHKHENKN